METTSQSQFVLCHREHYTEEGALVAVIPGAAENNVAFRIGNVVSNNAI